MASLPRGALPPCSSSPSALDICRAWCKASQNSWKPFSVDTDLESHANLASSAETRRRIFCQLVKALGLRTRPSMVLAGWEEGGGAGEALEALSHRT
eukprot:scaffold1102_cov256-Pinguiococcus_pyrenoidosus.AAC.44